MAQNGYAFVPSEEGGFTQEGGERAMRRLLDAVPEPDGVYAADDAMAQGAVHILRDSGRRVPGEVAVIGFDDSSAALSCRPPLTTVRQPVEDMAAEMARMLLDLTGRSGVRPTSVIFEPSLVVRLSA